MKPLVISLLLIGMPGCLPDKGTDDCGAHDLQDIVGQDSSVLQSMTLPDPNRVLQHNQPMTMDHNPGRLNIQSDENGLIARVWCG